jgi:hypothetical protein
MNGMFASATGKVLTAILAGVSLSAAAAAQEPRISDSALQQIEALMQEKASRTPEQRKISSDLLFEIRRQRGDAIVQAVPSLRSSVRAGATGRVLVDIRAEVTAGLLGRIAALGGSVASAYPQYGAVRASLPLMQIEALGRSPQVASIRPAARPIASKTNTSEGDIAHMADLARDELGVDGSGAKVCVLSDSVDFLAEVQATGDLPPSIEILPGQDGVALDNTIGEGTAMLEIVHDLAPGASLGFATAWAGEASFAQNILDLRAAGCDVLVDDVLYLAEPVFQDGIIAQNVDTVVADGAVYFSAAGNFGNQNDGTSGVWEGDFVATTNPLPAPYKTLYDAAQDFGGGDAFNTITVDSAIGYTLQWSDPQGASANDYDLYLLDSTGTSVVDFSNNFQTGTQNPFEGIDSEVSDDTGRQLVIVRITGDAARYVHLNAIGGQLEFATAGQTWGHSAARGAFSVAAVDWFQDSATPVPFTGAESIETFGSDGPRRVFYEGDGTAITPGDVSATGGELRQKPDLAAADGVSTATPGFNPFFGSSAAAPHAAAIAGLMLSIDSTLNAADMRDVFASTALDIEAPGLDRDSGVGIVDAPAALAKLKAVVATDFNADALSDILWRYVSTGNTVIWQMNGFTKSAAASIGAPPTAWVIEEVGDVNNDLRSDIMWRNRDTSAVTIWIMDGFTKVTSGTIGAVGTVWNVESFGDFDGDGLVDILWRNKDTGNVIIWQMDGFAKLDAASIGAPPLSWRIFGVADFNGDGKADILWRHNDTGATVVWQMDGFTKTTAVTIGSPPPAWKIEGIADFDGGGQPDILWRNSSTGATTIWQMNGYTKEAAATIGTVNSAWAIVRLGDFNGGGQADILWRRSSDGSTVIWQMDGFVKEAAQLIGTVSSGWEVQ